MMNIKAKIEPIGKMGQKAQAHRDRTMGAVALSETSFLTSIHSRRGRQCIERYARRYWG